MDILHLTALMDNKRVDRISYFCMDYILGAVGAILIISTTHVNQSYQLLNGQKIEKKVKVKIEQGVCQGPLVK